MSGDGTPEHRYKRPESVLVVVYTSEGDVLVLKRVDHDDFWQSVTGSLLWPSETPESAARRELTEETGLSAGSNLCDWHQVFSFPILPRWQTRYAPGTAVNREHAFTLEVDDRPPIALNLEEHCEYQWLQLDAAAAKVWSWTNRAMILALQDRRRRQ